MPSEPFPSTAACELLRRIMLRRLAEPIPAHQALVSLAWAKTHWAKHRAEVGSSLAGAGTRVLKVYTFSRRKTMLASPSAGWPVAPAGAANPLRRFKSCNLVVIKIGAEPRYSEWPVACAWFCGRATGKGDPSNQRHCVANGITEGSNL